ncbi:MAG: FGGY-family carbohydrate kinase, partial [Gemmatimonadota bacterium]|nr:FGGY-family carbohydrate kinase [Gemmatimonadota bacterium]
KVRWLLERDPGLQSRAEAGDLAMGTIDTWLMARLTGGETHATDPTNASRTLLFNLETRSWDPHLLDLLGIPAPLLPEVRASSGPFGTVRGDTLGIEVPILGVAGDQQAALFGQGCWDAGLAKNTYGTGAFLLLHTGAERVVSRHGLLTTAACDARGGMAYALEGSVFIAGAAIQWLRDGLGLLESAGDSEGFARALGGNDGVYFVPAFVGLGAPHWEPDARGMLFGLTRGTTRGHLIRAALESMAYGTSEVLRSMEADSGVETAELRIDGGASLNDWLAQFQADILNVPVHRPAMVETTAMGAAGLAGMAGGVWADAYEFSAAQAEGRRFLPSMEGSEREGLLRGWNRAVKAALAWARGGDTE